MNKAENISCDYASFPISRVAIVSKRKLDQIGLRSILASIANVLVVGQFDGDEMLQERLRRVQAQVVVLCLVSITPENIAFLQTLMKQSDKLKSVCIVPSIHPRILRSLVRAGCHACVLEDTIEGDLSSALQHVTKGQCWVSPTLTTQFYFPPYVLDKGAVLLEQKDLVLARLLVQGYRNRDIADQVGLTIKSVERRLSVLYNKLNVHSRTQAVALLTQEGLLFD